MNWQLAVVLWMGLPLLVLWGYTHFYERPMEEEHAELLGWESHVATTPGMEEGTP